MIQEISRLEVAHQRKEAQRHFERMSFYYQQAEEAFRQGNFDEDLFYAARKNYLEAKNNYESIRKYV